MKATWILVAILSATSFFGMGCAKSNSVSTVSVTAYAINSSGVSVNFTCDNGTTSELQPDSEESNLNGLVWKTLVNVAPSQIVVCTVGSHSFTGFYKFQLKKCSGIEMPVITGDDDISGIQFTAAITSNGQMAVYPEDCQE
ncbi:hypothetical protein [Bdellovibrio sp. HCB209]|uniref:hypothetical protein n=1 Tax=Bdellovibrio sp. HCB209 TaxID=3394354 RepID=UPI0039B3DA86